MLVSHLLCLLLSYSASLSASGVESISSNMSSTSFPRENSSSS